jgi:hypothetical protein
MQYYKIRKDGFKEIRKQTLIRAIPMMLIAVTIGIASGIINSKNKPTDVNVLPIIIPLITGSVGLEFIVVLIDKKACLKVINLL